MGFSRLNVSSLNKHDLLEVVCNNATVALFIMDERQKCVYMNPAAEKLTGYTLGEVEGNVLHKIIHYLHRDGTPYPVQECPIDQAMPTNRKVQGEEVFIHKNGLFYNVQFTASPIRAGDGTSIGTVIEIQDLTAEREREDSLRGAEGFLKAAIKSSAGGFYAIDRNGVTTACNDAFLSMLGFSSQTEVIGKKLHDVIHHTHPDGSHYAKQDCPIYQAAQTGKPGHVVDELFFRLNGTSFPVEYWCVPIVRDGEVTGAVTTFLDITERKRAEATLHYQVELLKQSQLELGKSMETLKTLNELGSKLSAELDLDKLVQSVTDTATKLCGAQFGALFYRLLDPSGEAETLYAVSGVSCEEFTEFLMPQNPHVFSSPFEGEAAVWCDDITKEERFRNNVTLNAGRDSSGRHLPVVSYLAVPVASRSGEVIGRLFLGHSRKAKFTERHQQLLIGVAAQAAIAIDNARLYKRSQESVRARDEFLSIASHELKTPLTSLKLQAQLHRRAIVKKDHRAYAPESVDAIIQQTEKQVARLTRLVDDMLDVARIRTGKLHIERESVNLFELVHESIKRLQNQFESAKCELPTVHPCQGTDGEWDRLRIEQVVTNLLTNALRYGNNKPIDVSFEVNEEAVTLMVKDHGIGISESAQTRIFDRFERAVDANEVSGLGLGLFITKQLVFAHGGKIWVLSRLGEGSTFLVQLPKKKQSSLVQSATSDEKNDETNNEHLRSAFN